MFPQDNRAVDAIWKTELDHAHEKLVLYHLATKHELGDRYSSAWKPLERFLTDFNLKWAPIKDLKEATRLSDIKLQRTIEGLLKKGYITKQDNQDVKQKGGMDAFVYGITPKIFEDYQMSLQPSAKKKPA